jgi:hypothetical protein
LWSHDDGLVLYSDRRSSEYETWTVTPDGSSRAERYFENPLPNSLTTSVAPHGTLMGYGVHPVTNRDIWIRRPDGEITILLETPANERAPMIAPAGRLFAYVSDEEGSEQIYLRDLDALERRWQVSTGSGVRIGDERLVFSHDRLERGDWGNRTFDSLPD